jgi:hypothetical protein
MIIPHDHIVFARGIPIKTIPIDTTFFHTFLKPLFNALLLNPARPSGSTRDLVAGPVRV